MSSIADAFSNGTFEKQYRAFEQAKSDAENEKRANALFDTFGIPFSEMRGSESNRCMTRDGSKHYVHIPSGKLYKYVYAHDTPKWIKGN